MTVAVIPFKTPARAKSRLATCLSAAEREGLARAMLADVLAALEGARNVAAIFIVVEDPALVSEASMAIVERANRGYDAAVTTALADPRVAGSDAMLILPADIPMVRAEEIDAMAAPFDGPGIRLAPDRDEDGTNALLIQPPGLIQTSFGPGSYARHLTVAERTVPNRTETLRLGGLALDIDTPQDLSAFLAADPVGHAAAFLERSGIAARLSETFGRTPCG